MSDDLEELAHRAWITWLETPPDKKTQSFWGTEDIFKEAFRQGAISQKV